MKKYIPYLLLLLALSAGVGYFVWRYSPSTLSKMESEFAIRNTDAITKVVLSNRKGEKLTLTKNNKHWLVNGKYEMNEEIFGLLFTAIQKMEAMYPVPINAQEIVLKDFAQSSIRCELYLNGADQPAKAYIVGGPTADGTGTYMLLELDGQVAARPYVTAIPGMPGYMTPRFITDEEVWRTKWIYRDNDQTIKSLHVEYNRERQKSFSIQLIGKDSFTLANSEGVVGDQPKQKFIHQYLQFYSALSMESYMNAQPVKDTILAEVPFCTINLERRDGSRQQTILYYMPVNSRSKAEFDDQGRKLLYDTDHYYALINDRKDFVMVQFYVWGNAMHSYQEFFIKPSKQS